MPLMSSSGVSLVVPPSQNTAEVHEFRCLFTHDVRRKAKRWKDGFLSFHTFNNRAIVYDELRHRIGDTYARVGEPVAEGDELTLQQGVLVEVGEPNGSREQDVSQVIAVKERDGGARPASGAAGRSQMPSRQETGSIMVPPAQMKRPAIGIGQQGQEMGRQWKPKSLKEVLNTPSGSMGRARPLNQSPYERRRGVLSGPLNGGQPLQICQIAPPVGRKEDTPPPKKRQRIEDQPREPSEGQLVDKTPDQRIQNRTSRTANSARQQLTMPKKGAHRASPIFVDSDEENLEKSPTVTPIFTRIASPSKTAKLMEPSPTKEVAPRPQKRAKSQQSKGKNVSKSSSRATVQRPSKHDHTTSLPKSRPLQERPANILRPSASGRRRKLMYRDLLPESFVPRDSESQSSSERRSDAPKKHLDPAKQEFAVSLRKLKKFLDKEPQISPEAASVRLQELSLLNDQCVPDNGMKEDGTFDAQQTGPPGKSGFPVKAILTILRRVGLEEALKDRIDPDAIRASRVREAQNANDAGLRPEIDDAGLATSDMGLQDEDFSLDIDSDIDTSLLEKGIEATRVRDKPSPPKAGEKETSNTAVSPQPDPPVSAAPVEKPAQPAKVQAAGHPPARAIAAAAPRPSSLRQNNTAQTHPRPPPAPSRPARAAAVAAVAPVPVVAQYRSPLKRVASAPAPESPRRQGQLQKSFSDMSTVATDGAAKRQRQQQQHQAVLLPLLEEEDDGERGPWSREAFDLFGWRPGDPKGVVDAR